MVFKTLQTNFTAATPANVTKSAMSIKVGWPLDVAWQNSSLQIFTCFHHFLFLFVGSSPTQGDFFFMKSDIKWAFLHIF